MGLRLQRKSGWLGDMYNIKQQRGLRVREVAGLGRMPNPKQQIEQFLNQTAVGKGDGMGQLGKEEKLGERGLRRVVAIQVFWFYFHI